MLEGRVSQLGHHGDTVVAGREDPGWISGRVGGPVEPSIKGRHADEGHGPDRRVVRREVLIRSDWKYGLDQ